jgi:hypothetical protein
MNAGFGIAVLPGWPTAGRRQGVMNESRDLIGMQSFRPLLEVAPAMCRLNVVRMLISPGRSHTFGLPVVGDNIPAVGKRLVTDCALPVLLVDFLFQQFAHLCRRAEFAISPRVVRIFDALNGKPDSAFLPSLLPAAAEARSVEWAVLIST